MDIMNTKYVTLGEPRVKANSTIDEFDKNLEAANNYLKAIQTILKPETTHDLVFKPTQATSTVVSKSTEDNATDS